MEVATGGFFLSYQNIKITSGFFLTRTGGVIKLLEVLLYPVLLSRMRFIDSILPALLPSAD